jgi:Zn-dependent alcohol dehydrogenase
MTVASMNAIDPLDSKLSLARELGVEHTINAASEDPAEANQGSGCVVNEAQTPLTINRLVR